LIENVELFLQQYGYIAVFIGTFIEGEIFLIITGFFIKHGFLNPTLSFIFGILGALVHELIYFYLGKWKGRQILLGNRYTRKKYKKAKQIIEKYGLLAIFLVRFMYGMRVIPMLIFGATGFNALKFIFFDIISLSIWAVFFISAGYFLGHTAEYIFGKAKEYYLIFGLIIIFIGLIWILIHYYRKSEEKK